MKIPITKPTLPPITLFEKTVAALYKTGNITNGQTVRRLERDVEELLGIGNAVAVSNGTSGLMLALKCLQLSGRAAVPSFTFFATAHAAAWNGLEPVFVDVDVETWNISLPSLEQVIADGEEISVVMPVHVFGNPCDVEGLDAFAARQGCRLVYDSAHAMGARVGEKQVGVFGDAEVFSLSPTKLVTSGEGGLIATRNSELADILRGGRDYGNMGDYDPAFIGLNARMSEFNAALGIESLKLVEENVQRRNAIADRYKELLSSLPGIFFQRIEPGNRSTYKDFTVRISEELFGMNRDALAWHLSGEGIDTRKYYYPPVHRTAAYWERWGKKYEERLPVTNELSKSVLSLPVWSHMEMGLVEFISEKINDAHERADAIQAAYSKTGC